MICYRIKHKKSGLYFMPAREIQSPFKNANGYGGYTKSNLSKTGKIYHKKPNLESFKKVVDRYYTHLEPGHNVLFPVEVKDWEVEIL